MTWGAAGKHADDGISDLIFDQLRIAARPFGENNDLNIGQVGNGIELDALDGNHASHNEKQNTNQHEELVVRAPADDAFDDRLVPNQPRRLLRRMRRRIGERASRRTLIRRRPWGWWAWVCHGVDCDESLDDGGGEPATRRC